MDYELWSLMVLAAMCQIAMKMREFLVVLAVVLARKPHFRAFRVVILLEAGTHLIFGALMCPYRIGAGRIRFSKKKVRIIQMN